MHELCEATKWEMRVSITTWFIFIQPFQWFVPHETDAHLSHNNSERAKKILEFFFFFSIWKEKNFHQIFFFLRDLCPWIVLAMGTSSSLLSSNRVAVVFVGFVIFYLIWFDFFLSRVFSLTLSVQFEWYAIRLGFEFCSGINVLGVCMCACIFFFLLVLWSWNAAVWNPLVDFANGHSFDFHLLWTIWNSISLRW